MKNIGTLFMLMVLLFSVFKETGAVPGSMEDCCCGMCGGAQMAGAAEKGKKGDSHKCCPCMALVQVNAPIYVTPEPVILPPVVRKTQVFLPLHHIGELSSHYASDWKPPKASFTYRIM